MDEYTQKLKDAYYKHYMRADRAEREVALLRQAIEALHTKINVAQALNRHDILADIDIILSDSRVRA